MLFNNILRFRLGILLLFCSFITNAQTAYEASLSQAGKNRAELEKVISYYTQNGDKQKLSAAQYLLSNMNGLFFYDGEIMKKYNPFFEFLDSLNRNNIPKKDRTSLKLIKPIEDIFDFVNNSISPRDYNSITQKLDASYLSANQIIKHIDLAFVAWKSHKWSQGYSFDEFCEYILPYKVFNEQPEAWMEYFSNKYSKTLPYFNTISDPTVVADSINKEVESWFKFGTLFYKYPFDMGLSRLLQSHVGNCNSMVTAAIYALRSAGVACAVDHCPQYGNRALGHTWVGLLDKDKQTVPVNGASTEWLEMGYVFSEQTLNVKLPKVLRKTYAPQANSLAMIHGANDLIPPQFENAREKDVSADYMPVSTIKLALDKSVTKDLKYAYLCVFDNKNWVPVWWGKVKNDTAVFRNMGREIVYLPMSFNGREMKPIAAPFCLAKNGDILPITSYKGRAQSLKLFNKYPPNLTGNNDTTNAILKTDVYELFYWDNKWISLGKKTTANRQADLDSLGFDFKKKQFLANTEGREFIFYETAPVGTLFLLHNWTQGKEERIFTIENEEQIWW